MAALAELLMQGSHGTFFTGTHKNLWLSSPYPHSHCLFFFCKASWEIAIGEMRGLLQGNCENAYRVIKLLLGGEPYF